MNPKVHYIVRHATPSKESGRIEVREHTNRTFKHDEPIEARKAAFDFYENYQSGVIYYRSHYASNNSESSDRSAGTSTDDIPLSEFAEDHPFFNLSEESKRLLIETTAFYGKHPFHEWSIMNPEKSNRCTPYGDAVIIMVIDPSLKSSDDDDSEIVIHQTISIEDNNYEVSYLMDALVTEYKLYQEEGYEIGNQRINVPFWDVESYFEGQSQEKWYGRHTILKTPFDWSPFANENWWGDPDFLENYQRKLLNEQIDYVFNQHDTHIKNGESQTVEFKVALFKTIEGTDNEGKPYFRNMQLEVAETIGAFLNSHGGNIYVGVRDNGQIVGVNFEGRSKDQYKRDFSRLKNSFFGHHSEANYLDVLGDFITVSGKEIFCIGVRASDYGPIFLRKFNDESQKPEHLFFVRTEAATIPLFDPIRMVSYIEHKWWRKIYRNKQT